MVNRRPPSRFGANSLSVKLSMLISAVCLIAGVFAAALMLKSEERQLIYEEYSELKRVSSQAVVQFSQYLDLKTSLAEQANIVVTKQLFTESTLLHDKPITLINENKREFRSTAKNGLSAAYLPAETLTQSDRRLFSQSESLWNIIAPPLLQDFFNFYLVTTRNFVRIAPPNILLNNSPNKALFSTHALPLLREELNPTREAIWSRVHFDTVWNKWVISILVPLYDSDEYLGFTGTDVELKTLLSHLPAPDSRQGFVIFDQQGHIIAAPNLRVKRSENSVTSGKAISIPALNNVIESALLVKLPEFQDEFTLDGEGHIINIQQLKQLDWYIGVYKKRDSALSALEELKVKFFGLFLLYALFVALLLHQVLYQLVLGRINLLVNAVVGFGRGQWDMPSMPSSNDEIGQLNASFNDMSEEIKKLVTGLNQRITEKEIAEKAANRLSKAVSFSGTAVVITNEYFQIEYVNPKMLEMTGFEESHFLSAPLLSIISKEMAILVDDIDIDLRSRNYWRGDTMLAGSDPKPIWVSLSISPIREDGGQISSYVASAQDISFVKESQRKMEELAYFDTLTGLANRTFFRMQLRKSMALAERGHYAFALFYFDLDEFKRINDTLGHDAGDRLLVEVAERLKLRLRSEDTIARLGGDEFAVLLSGIDKRENAMEVAHIIQRTLNKPIKLGNNEVIVSASIGITMAPFDSKEEEQLLKHADLAMYEAKAKGRNTFHFYSQELDAAANERLYIENELRQAIKAKQFTLFYQPQVDCKTMHIVGYEALIRWKHPEKGMIPPTKFIPIAEATGLIVELGVWVLEEACLFSMRLQRQGRSGNMSINLSARQFKDAHLINEISDVLQRTQMPAEKLHLELTESMLMGDVEAAITQLHQMKDLGVGLSIDDFGTGYSSLSYLKRFPVDTLKVDRSFVKDIPADSNDMEITAAIIAMAQKLNLQVVAEGVETKEQVAFLKRNNCYIVQGYYYSPPLPEHEIEIFRSQLQDSAGN
ncbi:bifunctional diguanylate cyclase/phosphodiesterase [Pseudoalteromonas aurantia]|uniref:cyclic-guanylate-specific phosphodiesterase n=1 Tax=Pseudoalteromonas aurantia TaxID=43654 RepID=A0A5S3VE47_9GAMM|nr:EAL domain-containing protein [Pseudoalteromonas aurantia]TMO65225.1 diguanylate phosphodiesterase [Pseudoalteromonas aurantia]TMO70509.1 diguanylate phosphodiesterase [Pseudoalteromonas aurantia]TMO77625.1 diguanylate phosphodiesterase [Pseudoalteromonas aurantia]